MRRNPQSLDQKQRKEDRGNSLRKVEMEAAKTRKSVGHLEQGPLLV
jgi:hypothetical protein